MSKLYNCYPLRGFRWNSPFPIRYTQHLNIQILKVLAVILWECFRDSDGIIVSSEVLFPDFFQTQMFILLTHQVKVSCFWILFSQLHLLFCFYHGPQCKTWNWIVSSAWAKQPSCWKERVLWFWKGDFLIKFSNDSLVFLLCFAQFAECA